VEELWRQLSRDVSSSTSAASAALQYAAVVVCQWRKEGPFYPPGQELSEGLPAAWRAM
jgi:hypothetical protein